MTAVSDETGSVREALKNGAHYLGAIRSRLERLYKEHPNDCRLREQISDEVDWVDGLTAALSAAPVSDAVATVTYTNWRGETSVRRIIPKSVRYGSTEWHPEPQWLLLAWDDDKKADREFALKDFRAAPVGGPLRRIVLDTLNAVAPAVENLSVHQEQCDRDGVMVKVSRQALDEVLNAVNEVAMQSAITASPDAPVAQEPVARLVPTKNLVAMLALLPPAPVDVNGEQFAYHDPNAAERLLELRQVFDALIAASPLYISPPATPAGLGADEIARALKETLVAGLDAQGTPIISGFNSATTAILALLSRTSPDKSQT